MVKYPEKPTRIANHAPKAAAARTFSRTGLFRRASAAGRAIFAPGFLAISIIACCGHYERDKPDDKGFLFRTFGIFEISLNNRHCPFEWSGNVRFP